jgi:hypothetical protein
MLPMLSVERTASLSSKTELAGLDSRDGAQGLGQKVLIVCPRVVSITEHDLERLVRTGSSVDNELGFRVNRVDVPQAMNHPAWYDSEALPFLGLDGHPGTWKTPGNGHGCGLKKAPNSSRSPQGKLKAIPDAPQSRFIGNRFRVADHPMATLRLYGAWSRVDLL